MWKKILLFLLLAVCGFLAAGCPSGGGSGINNRESDDDQTLNKEAHGLVKYNNQDGEGLFYRQPEPPPEIAAWVDAASRKMFMGQGKIYGKYLYILVTYGPKSTGGYSARVTSVQVEHDEVIVKAAFTRPGPGDMVTQGFTYPYDLVLIPAVDLPLKFVATGHERHIPTP